MIPKQLFFIWFGDKEPDYLQYSIDSFKSLNPKFSIDLIRYTIDDVLNCNDSILCGSKKLIFDTINGIDNKYYHYIKYRLKSKFNFIQILSDFIRYEILYNYGGIYLDCDTFPVKPFDDELLNNSCFAQNILCFRNKKYSPESLMDDYSYYYDLDYVNDISKYFCYCYTDIYFVGACKKFTDKEIKFTTGAECNIKLNPPWIRNFENSICFKKMRDLFLKHKLKLFKDHFTYNHYIMHFPSKGWQSNYKTHPLYCEYDDIIYKD